MNNCLSFFQEESVTKKKRKGNKKCNSLTKEKL